MKIAHLGHSAVLVKTEKARILIDPGNFSTAWHDLTDLDAIVVTHAHPDHGDPEWMPRLVDANPSARVLVEAGVPKLVDCPRATVFAPGDTAVIQGAVIQAVGGRHAVIHRDIPRIGNIGVVVRTESGPAFFHPGDALDTVPNNVDILAAPAHGPWCAMKEIIDFVREVQAASGFLIHDGLLNDRGWTLSFTRLNEMTGTVFTDLRSGELTDLTLGLDDVQGDG